MRRLALMTAGVIALGGLAGLTTASPAHAASGNFTNSTPIPVADAATTTSNVVVSPFGGAITDVDVVLTGVTHAFANDLDVYLQAPGEGGVAVKLLSDTCSTGAINNVTFTFDDEAAGSVPNAGCGTGTYKPTDVGADTPPPGLNVAPTLAAFDGRSPVGAWVLHVVDDLGVGSGTISGGFTVKLTTAPSVVNIPTAGVAQPYPHPIVIGNRPGRITDVDVVLGGLSHSFPSDLDILLVGPTGTAVVLASDVCGSADLNLVRWRFDDAAANLTTAGPCASGSFRPTNQGPGDVFPAPAPAGPHGDLLAAFNGQPASGVWQLYVNDDAGPDGGFITSVDLVVQTDAPGNTTITNRPRRVTKSRKATIGFSADKGEVTFQCKIDKRAWKACSSPLRVKHLKPGKHKVRVRSVGSSGQVETTPAVVRWRVRR